MGGSYSSNRPGVLTAARLRSPHWVDVPGPRHATGVWRLSGTVLPHAAIGTSPRNPGEEVARIALLVAGLELVGPPIVVERDPLRACTQSP